MGFHSALLGNDLHAPTNTTVINNTGSTLTSLKVVKANGFSGSSLQVTPLASVMDKPSGIIQSDILNTATGTMVGIGILSNVDTSPWTVGSLLFSDASGDLTLSDTGLFVGTVLIQNATTGSIYINVSILGADGPVGAGATQGVVLVTPTTATSQASIVAALATAVSGDAVVVGPGTYAESVIIPAGVVLIAPYGPVVTNITGALATGTRVTLNDGSRLDGFDVTLPTDAVPAILYSGAATASAVRSRTSGVNTTSSGIRATSGLLRVSQFTHTGDANIVIEAAGGNITLAVAAITPGTANCGLKVSGGATLTPSTVTISGVTSLTDGIEVADGKLRGSSVTIELVTTGIHVTSNSADIQVRSHRLDSVTNDILVDPALVSGTFHFVAGEADSDKITAPVAWRQGAFFLFSYQDENSDGDVAFRISGELSVGTTCLGAEANFGGGESSSQGMIVFQNDNQELGTFTDITAALASPSGSTAILFTGTGANNTVFFGGDAPFYGIKHDTTVAIAIGTGVLVWEFWNGSTWIDVKVLSTDDGQPFNSYAQDSFGRIAFEHIRSGDTAASATKLINGATKFWLRVRITTAITTSPTIEKVKLQTSRSEITEDGTITFFGLARPLRQFLSKRSLLEAQVGISPVNEDILVSTNIGIAAVSNEFVDGKVDALSALVLVPEGADTSQVFECTVDWFRVSGTGDVELELDFAVVAVGDILNGTLPETRLSDITTTVTDQLVESSIFNILVPDANPGDYVAIRVFRDSTGGNADDTLTGSIALVETRLEGKVWKT